MHLIFVLHNLCLSIKKQNKKKPEFVPTNNIAAVLLSEGNETPVEHVHITIEEGFLLWRTHCSFKKHFYCEEQTVPQGLYVMTSPHYKATEMQAPMHVWKICKHRLTKHNDLVAVCLCSVHLSLTFSHSLIYTMSWKSYIFKSPVFM